MITELSSRLLLFHRQFFFNTQIILRSINISLNTSRKAMSSSLANISTGKTPTKRPEIRTKKTPSKGTKKSPSEYGLMHDADSFKIAVVV